MANKIIPAIQTNEGNVGIGTTDPAYKLDVAGAIRVTGVGQIGPAASLGFAVYNDRTNNLAGQVYGRVNGLQFTDNIGNNTVYVASGGYVGIGMTTPIARLQVSDAGDIPYIILNTSSVADKRVRLQFTKTGNAGMELGTDYSVNNANNFYMYDRVNGTTFGFFSYNSTWFNANVGIGTVSPLAVLSIGNGSLNDVNVPVQISSAGPSTEKWFGANRNGGYGLLLGYSETTALAGSGAYVRQVTTDPLHFVVNNTSVAMSIVSNGNVGIGNTIPSQKLDVNGAIIVGINNSYGAYTRSPGGVVKPWFATSGPNTFFYNTNLSGSIFWQNAADTASLMTLSEQGRLGVNTNNPSGRLHVLDTVLYPPSLTWNAAAATIIRSENGQIAFGSDDTAPYGIWQQVRTASSTARPLLLNPLGGNVGVGVRNPTKKLHVGGSFYLDFGGPQEEHVVGISRTVASAAGSYTEIGVLANSGYSNRATFEIFHHNCGTIEYSLFELMFTYYTGATTDWVQLPSRTVLSYSGAPNGVVVDARLTANGNSAELRLRSIGGACGNMIVYVRIKSNSNLTESSGTGTGATVAGLLGFNRYEFPISDNRFKATADGLFIKNNGFVGIGSTDPIGKLTVQGNIEVNYNSITADASVRRSFATSHAAINRGSNITFGLLDGASVPAGMTVYNVAAAAGAFNSQFITFNTHEGGVNEGERMRITQLGNVGIGTFTPLSLLAVGEAGSTTAAKGLTFGGDAQANLYRSAEDTIKTDGALTVAGLIYNNNSAFYSSVTKTAASNWGQYSVIQSNSSYTPQIVHVLVNGGNISWAGSFLVSSNISYRPNELWCSAKLLETAVYGCGVDDVSLLVLSSNPTTGFGGVALVLKTNGAANNGLGTGLANTITVTVNGPAPSAVNLSNSWTQPYTYQIATSANTKQIYTSENGTVGVGTYSPASAKLESFTSANSITFNHLATNLNNASPIPTYAFDVTNGVGESRSIKAGIGYERHLTNGRGTLHIYNRATNDAVNFGGSRSTPADIRVSIDNDGNVGINTTLPGARLDVVGTARLSANLLSHKTASYTTSYPGINSFGADATDTNITYYNTGKTVANQNFRGVVWTGKHYIFTSIGNAAFFYDNNFNLITNAYGLNSVTLPMPSGYANPHGAAWDGRYLWLICYVTGEGVASKIVGYDLDSPSGNAAIIAESAPITAATAAYDLEYADGHLYFVRSGNVYIYKWNGSTIDLVNTVLGEAGLITAQAITYDGSYLWVTQNDQPIYKLTLDGYQDSVITSGFPAQITGWAWNGSNIVTFGYASQIIYIINTTRLRIDTQNLALMGGRVGIGITNPGDRVQANLAAGESILANIISNAVSASNKIGFKLSELGTASAEFSLVRDGTSYQAKLQTLNNQPLSFGTNSATRMVILSNGNVGIGTTAPSSLLHLSATGTTELRITSTTSNTNSLVSFYENSLAAWGIDAGQANGTFFIKDFFNARSVLTLTSLGRVGICTTSPTTLLSIGGAGSTTAASGITFGGDAEVNLYRIGENILKTDGNFQVVGSIELRDVLYHYSNIRFLNKAGSNWLTWFTRDTSESEAISRLDYIRSINGSVAGNLGIGTTLPSGKLHVVSSVSNDTVLRADGTNGTLFSVVDDLSDSLMSVNNSAGLPVLEVFADDRVIMGQYGSGDLVVRNNKVGIGTTNPINKLSVIGGASIGSSAYNLATPTNGLLVEGNVGVGTTSVGHPLEVYGTSMDPSLTPSAASIVSVNSLGVELAIGRMVTSPFSIWLQGKHATVGGNLTYPIVLNPLGGNVGVGLTNPAFTLDVNGNVRAERYRGINSLVLNTYATVNPASNVFLYSQGNDRDSWLYLDSADTSSNWGIYHRQIDSTVSNLPGNSIGFIGGGTNTLQSYIGLANGNGYFAGSVGIGSVAPASKLDVAGNINIDGSSFHRVANDSIITAPSDHGLVAYYGFDEGVGSLIADKTGRNNTSSNALTYTTTAIRGTALDGFGGDTKYVIVPDSADFDFGTGDFAVSLWCRPNSSFTGVNNTLIEIGLYTAGILIRPQANTNTLEVYAQNVFITQPSIVWTANTWYHIVVTRVNSVLNVYSNGTRIASVANSLNIQVGSAGYIGRSAHASGQFFYGIIDEVKIYKGKGLDYGEVRGQYLSRGDSELVSRIFSNTNGYIGIGTTSPNSLLTVGAAGVTDAANGITFGGDAQANIYRNGEDTLATDGNFNAAGNVNSKNSRTAVYTSVTSGTNGTWYPLFTVGDSTDATIYCNLRTFAHGSVSFIVARGYNLSNTHNITILNCQINPNGGYANVTGVRIKQNGGVEIQLSWSSGPIVDVGVQIIGTNYTPPLVGNLTPTADGTPVIDSVVLTNGMIRTLRDIITEGGSVGIGIANPTNKLHVIVPTPTGSRIQLGSTSTSSLMNAGLVNDFLILTAPFNATPATTSNNNAKWGIKMGGGSTDAPNALEKSACIYAVSEDSLGYNRSVGLALHTSPFDLPNVERFRISSVGNVGIGSTSPSSKLDVYGGALTVGTKSSYALAVGNANTDLTFGANASNAYIQSWSSKPLYVNNQGNNTIIGADVGIGNVTPVGARLHIKGDTLNPVLRVEDAQLVGAAGGTAGKTFVGWLPIMTGALSPADKVFIPLYK